jgi:hypothetical protein
VKNPIHIGPKLDLPESAVTQTFAVLAKRGMGKSYLAAKMVEQMIGAGLPVVVVDPIGVFWGLRSSADGKRPGLPVVILGGDHADVPLEVTAGAVVADFVIDARQPAVLDLSLFRKGEQTRFMTDFAERLYHKNRAPLHVVMDEADAFAPQKPHHGEERLLGAIEDLVRRGRARGIGLTLVTQRSAVLNKNCLTQAEVLVALRTIAPQDRAAIDEWIKVHGTPEQREEMMASLPSLPVGTAWFWSPGWLDIFQRVEVARRETFDSSATPKVGAKVHAPKALAEVDLAGLRDRMATTIERAKADDPKELRRRIAELEKQLATKPAAAPAKVERIEVPVLTDADRKIILDLSDAAWKIGDLFGFKGPLGEIRERVAKAVLAPPASKLNGAARARPEPLPESMQPRPAETLKEKSARISKSPRRERVVVEGVGAGERRMLAVLAEQGASSREKVGLLAGFSPKGGTFAKYLSNLRGAGLVVVAGRDLDITDAGRAAAGDVLPMPTGRAAVDAWISRLGAGRGANIIRVLSDAGGGPLSRADVAELAGYEAKGGTFAKYLSIVRTAGLVHGSSELRLAEALR